MMDKRTIEKLVDAKACPEAIRWVESCGLRTNQEAWDACERGDWLLWLLSELKGQSQKKLVLAACKCARTTLKYVRKGELRPKKAIETAERWARDDTEVTWGDIFAATQAASNATFTANTNTCTDAFRAARSAYAAICTINERGWATDAAFSASCPLTTGRRIQKRCAKIVREFYPKAPRLTLLGRGA